MIRLTALLAGALLVATAAAAEPEREPTEVRVSTAGVDFNNREDVARVYRRLNAAAQEACDSGRSDWRSVESDRACAAKALDQAVRATHQPLLMAMHGVLPTIAVAAK
jgi:UrcA family protein